MSISFFFCLIFHSTHNIRGWLVGRCAMLFLYDFLQLIFVPFVHGVSLFIVVPHIAIERTLFCFPFYSQVVREFAFVPLCTLALFEKRTNYGFRIDSCERKNLFIASKTMDQS